MVDCVGEVGVVVVDDDVVWFEDVDECVDYGVGWIVGFDYDDCGVWFL